MKWILAVIGVGIGLFASAITSADVQYFARYEYNHQIYYGRIVDDSIQPLSNSPFTLYKAVGPSISLDDVKLLIPTVPQKVFAVGLNFASHMSSPASAPPPLFLKLPSSLIASGEEVQLPPDANNVHFEGELVLIIGKKAKYITEQQANEVIFGVTVGNDLTERTWQSTDLQWMRSKASDGFGPVASIIAAGVDYNNVLLTTRLNGDVVQQENTANMIHSPAKVVSYLSQYFTLMPGDLVFMGTPGRTQALKNGDVVSVTIDQVGKVENSIRTLE